MERYGEEDLTRREKYRNELCPTAFVSILTIKVQK